MELYSMPQLDKPPPTYSDIHYVERSNLASPSIPVDVKKFSPVAGDILTSSAWSAVIHRPAEDSEPEDLPSTVDMDAIKGSPSTSLPTTGPLPWSESDRGHEGGGEAGDDSGSGDDDDDDDEEDDDDDEDNDKEDSSSENESSSPNSDCDDADSESGTAQGSGSESDSESSSRNSYDSDSDSASSSSCSSRSSESSRSSSSQAPKQFPQRDTEKCSSSLEQQHLNSLPKSRIASLKSSQLDDQNTLKESAPVVHEKVDGGERRVVLKKDDRVTNVKESISLPSKNEHPREDLKRKEQQESFRNPVKCKIEINEDRSREKQKAEPQKHELQKTSSSRNTYGKDNEAPSSRTLQAAELVTASRYSVGSLPSSKTTFLRYKDELTTSRFENKASPSILTSTTQTSSAAVPVVSTDSGSDVELPDQVVSDAIKRIQADSEDKSEKGTVGHEDEDEDDEQNEDSSDDASTRRGHYSSSLLQKFVESTERLSGKRVVAQGRTSDSKHNSLCGSSYSHKEAARRRRGRAPQASSATSVSIRYPDSAAGSCVRNGPADLEVYCSVSNVSPDSGIYCVNGSPWHQSSPAHSPQHPPHQIQKTVSSPPRSINKQDHRRKHTSLKLVPSSSSKVKSSGRVYDCQTERRVPPMHPVHDSEDEASSSSPLLSAPARRGPGRPKKAPPILEPCLPYHPKTSSKRSHFTNGSQNKNRKQIGRKESESSDQSVERCDKMLAYTTHKSRGEVQVTSQGVQCDQSEFPQFGPIKVKKKKKNQGYHLSQDKSYLSISSSNGQKRTKSHQESSTLQNVCDRFKKSMNSGEFGLEHIRPSKSSSSFISKEGGLFKRASHSIKDTPLSYNVPLMSSSSRRRPSTSFEKRRKGEKKGEAELLAEAAAILLSSSAVASSSNNVSQRKTLSTVMHSSKSKRPSERIISLPRGLKPHHKHSKKHSKRRKHIHKKPTDTAIIDPQFLEELEELSAEFQRSCFIVRGQQLVQRLGEGSSGTRLPSIFRVKRIVKKRKGSERSKNSDRDSGPEVENSTSTPASASRDNREKGSTGGKRRPKKSAVETPKGQRPEANNEQRLPLKKRHYHMSTAPNQQSCLSSSPEMSLDVSSSAEDKPSNNGESPTSSVSSKSSSSLTPWCSKSATPSMNNASSRSVVSSVIAMKSNLPPASSSKVTLVMPATSSCPVSNELPPPIPSILSKADSSASFASVCQKSELVASHLTGAIVEKTNQASSSAIETSNRLSAVPSSSSKSGSHGTHSSLSLKSTLTAAQKPMSGTTSSNMALKSIADSSMSKTSSVSSVSTAVAEPSSPLSDCSSYTNIPFSSSTSAVLNSKSHSVTPGTAGSVPSSSARSSPSASVAEEKPVKNSYDEAIEACISKYSSDMHSLSLATRSVITTPKKRHRIEMQGKPSSGKAKEVEPNVHSTSGASAQNGKRSNSRSMSSGSQQMSIAAESIQISSSLKLSPPPPTHQALSPGGSKLPESGIFEPSSSSEHYVVNVSLPETPVKSVIAGLSKLKGTSSAKVVATQSSEPETSSNVLQSADSYALTSHNLRQKKSVATQPFEEEVKCPLVAAVVIEKIAKPHHIPEEEPCVASKNDLDPKGKAKSKSKNKRCDDVEKSSSKEIPVTQVKSEAPATDLESVTNLDCNTSNDFKEVRIHVEKLSSSEILPQKGREKSTQPPKTCSSVPKRRRKCNRTGFPVIRKRKKKETNLSESVKTEEEKIVTDENSVLTCVTSSTKSVRQTSGNVEVGEQRSSSRVQLRKEHGKKEGNEVSVSPDFDDCRTTAPKDELHCSGLNVVKLEHKEENQSVILKSEDCLLNTSSIRDIKQEAKVQEPSGTVMKNNSISVETKSTGLNCVLKPSESSIGVGEDLPPVPYIDRIPNKEKYMFAGFTKRQDTKPNKKIHKPSKAVIRAMRAKFSENITLPDISAGSRKGSKPVPCTWSSDESDDSTDPLDFFNTHQNDDDVDDPEAIVAPDNLETLTKCDKAVIERKSQSKSSKSRRKRDMKRQATFSVEEPIKSKCSKSGNDVSQSSSTIKGKSNSRDARNRRKRKYEVEGLPSSAEIRSARSRKRLRIIQKVDTDSQETDCDEGPGNPAPSTSNAVGDALTDDETIKTELKDAKLPRWRKKYLPAGLLSDYFKLDEPRPVNDGKKGLQYKPEDHPHGLLPPPFHCGKWLRQRRINFQLPYDLWWLHTHNKLPGRDIVPSWNYKKIRTNVYYNVKPSYVHEPQACDCKTPENGDNGCGDDCLNRLVYTECSPALCPLKELCSNQKIQRHEWSPGLDRFMTKEKGWGVRTKQSIKNGDFILEYVGEVVSDKEFKDRMATIYTQDTHHYCLHLDGGLVIDGHRMGGDGRFVNHSCEPNCEMQKWSVNGLFRMALFALRDIEPYEELGYDYNFSLFNASEGQPCKCGSSQCRGVIGGKSQRVNMLPSSQNGSSTKVSVEDIAEKKGSRKNKRKTCRKNDGERAAENLRQRKRVEAQRLSQLLALNIRHMSHQQRCFVQQHHCFLLRNLEKVRKLKEKLRQATQRADGYTKPAPANVKQSDVFLTQLNALSTPRNVRTRRLAQAEDNPELARNARLACVLRELYNVVVSAKDEKGEILSNPYMTLPNKRKLPSYYVRIREPLDFSTIEQNINSGLYCTLEAFDQDMCKVLNNNLRFYGRTTNLGIASVRLKKIYLDAKKNAHPQLMDVLGEALPASFVTEKNPAEEEDVIRCICGLYRDEGMMIQCERCLVWQHCDCVKADSTFEHYLCEICQPRPVDLEIVMDPQPSYTSEGQTEYVTLLRSDLQIRQGDTVYVLRDIIEGEGESQTKVTYKTIKDPKYGDMDIFRIERLWKDDNGERFAYGHHYLRPHETYHEPTRKFYPNEVMRVPLYEIISLDLIWARCWVLDPMTYCKGRPIEAVEEHVYICEYRVDKSAHLFYKISKTQSRANLCLKSYAFENFETRLKPVRTYTPHGPVPPLKPRIRGNQDDSSSTKSMQQSSNTADEEEEEVPLARVRDSAMAEKREKQRSHLNGILLRLLANQQCKQPLDISYLLDPGRRHRKKPSSLNT